MSNSFYQALKDPNLNPINSVEQINWCLQSISTYQKSLQTKPSSEIVSDFFRADISISQQYQSSVENIKNIIEVLDKMIQTNVSTSDENTSNLSPKENAQKYLDEWFMKEIKKAEAPMPYYAGCHSNKMKVKYVSNLKSDNHIIICGKYGDEYHLMVFINFSDDKLTAFDIFAGDGIELKLDVNEWTPLPAAIPKGLISRWEYQCGTKVMALKKEGDNWTNKFFPATVKKRPCDRKNEEVRGYLLAFEDNTEMIIPEKYVVPDSEKWNST